MNVVTFIRAIPNTVWAAIIASFLTLGGVLLTNRESTKRLLAQLKYDSAQRDRDREMSLRRDVYLQAAEAVSRIQALLGRLVDLSAHDGEFANESRINSAAIAKIQVIGNDKTVRAVSAFMNEFVAAYTELWFERIRLVERKNRIEIVKQYREKASLEQERWLELMKRMNLDGSSDPRRWQVINDNFEFARKQHERYSREEQSAWTEQRREHLQVLKSCIEHSSRLAELIPPAVFAVREELELPLNKDEYMKSFNESMQRSKVALEAFMQKVQQVADA